MSVTYIQGHNTASYDVAVPEADSLEEFESQGDWGTHSCIVQFTYHPTAKTTDEKVSRRIVAFFMQTHVEKMKVYGSNGKCNFMQGQSTKEVKCELKLKTVLGRILPKCNLKRGVRLHTDSVVVFIH